MNQSCHTSRVDNPALRSSAPAGPAAALLLALACLLLSAAARETAHAASAPDTSATTRAFDIPDLRLRTIDGEAVTLHELLAQGPVLLDFWALWCKPCLKELPELDRLQRRFAARGFRVVAINTDTPVEVAKVGPFVRTRDYEFRVATDLDGAIRRRFQVNAFPTAILLDSTGRIAWTNQGYRPGDEKTLEEKLLPLLEPLNPDSAATD